MTTEIAKTIKTKLKEKGKRQAWLAEKAGVSINAVSKWTKDGKISRQNVQAVADALGISADQLLTGAPVVQAPKQEETTLERLSAEEREIVDLYRRSTRDGQLFIRSAARGAEKLPIQLTGRPPNQN